MKIRSSINIPWGNARSHKKTVGPFGSAVLTLIGYKQTDRQAKYIHTSLPNYVDFQNFQNPILLEANF